MSPETGAAVGPAPQDQLAAVQAAVVRLQLLQGEVVGDATGARRRGEMDLLNRKLGGGGRMAAAMVTL